SRGLPGREDLTRWQFKTCTYLLPPFFVRTLLDPLTSHGPCLLSLSRDIRGTSYEKESGINSTTPDCPHYVAKRKWGNVLLVVRFAHVSRSSGQGRLNQLCSFRVHVAP